MPVAQWSERFETGIQFIDDQHRQLLESVNQLHDGFQNGMERDDISKLLEFLVAYIANHFTTEEGFMAEHGYPDLPRHREEHRTIMLKVRDLATRWNSPNPPPPAEFARFIRDWLAHHVSEVDMGYSAWAKRR